ncbi:MAG: enoyl-CoA hydratase, partial [Granulosicoccus sp.]|nr:enoyl-CoA hydratase [Granulosicoccus sp.]
AVLEYNAKTAEVYGGIYHAPKPTIALIQGHCIGGGLGLAVACDLRYCTDRSKFGLPAAKLGLGYPYAGLKRLSDIVGPAYAKEITFTGGIYDAAAAKDMRLVNGILADEELEAHVLATAEKIANNAPLTVSAMKNIYANVFMDPDERDLENCQAMVDRCFASEDYIEGRTAFMEKRPPKFKGR